MLRLTRKKWPMQSQPSQIQEPATQNAFVRSMHVLQMCGKCCPHQEKIPQHIHNVTNPLPFSWKSAIPHVNKMMRLSRKTRSGATSLTHFFANGPAEQNECHIPVIWRKAANVGIRDTYRGQTQLNAHPCTHLWGGGTKARNILVATRRSPKQWTQKSSDFFKF